MDISRKLSLEFLSMFPNLPDVQLSKCSFILSNTKNLVLRHRDGEGGKPWTNTNVNAMGDFWKSVHQWLPTWPRQEDRGMTVSKVMMWQQGECI